MHTQYLSKRSVITHCLTQRRSNQGVFLCRIIFTFMCLWGNWAASVESWLWASIETMNKLCIIVLQHMRRTYFRGLSSDLLSDGWKSCWLSSRQRVVSRAGWQPTRDVVEALVPQDGPCKGLGWTAAGQGRSSPAQALRSASSTSALLGLTQPCLELVLVLETGSAHWCASCLPQNKPQRSKSIRFGFLFPGHVCLALNIFSP